jgi:DNA polymerase-4
MERLGLVIGADIRAQSREFLDRHFGKSGGYYYWASRGIDHRPVNPHQERKSVGSETTFGEDLTTGDACMAELRPLIASVARWCGKYDVSGRTVTMKLRTASFRTVTRSRSVVRPISSPEQIEEIVQLLLNTLLPLQEGVRLLGVTLSNLDKGEAPEPVQPLLDFGDAAA